MTTNTVFPFTGETMKWADLPPDIFARLSKEFERRASEANEQCHFYADPDDYSSENVAYQQGRFDANLEASLLVDGAPKPDGWNVWVAEDAPEFKTWRKVAWLASDLNYWKAVIAEIEESRANWIAPRHIYSVGEVIAFIVVDGHGTEAHVVRRYRVLPADVAPDEAVQT